MKPISLRITTFIAVFLCCTSPIKAEEQQYSLVLNFKLQFGSLAVQQDRWVGNLFVSHNARAQADILQPTQATFLGMNGNEVAHFLTFSGQNARLLTREHTFVRPFAQLSLSSSGVKTGYLYGLPVAYHNPSLIKHANGSEGSSSFFANPWVWVGAVAVGAAAAAGGGGGGSDSDGGESTTVVGGDNCTVVGGDDVVTSGGCQAAGNDI